MQNLEPLFETADPECRNEMHPTGDWTEGGKYHAITAEERKMSPRPKGVQTWDNVVGRWVLVDLNFEPCYPTSLYRVPNTPVLRFNEKQTILCIIEALMDGDEADVRHHVEKWLEGRKS